MDLDGLSLKGGESQAFGFMDSLCDYQVGFLKEICLFELWVSVIWIALFGSWIKNWSSWI